MGIRDLLRRHVRDPVYANGVALALNAGAASALGFLFWLVAARRFDAAALGYGAAVVSAATLAALVGKAGFDAAVIRFMPSAKPRLARKLLLYALGATVALTALVAVALLALAGRGMDALAPLRSPTAAAGFLLLACATSAAWILDALFIAEQSARLTLLRNLAFHGVKLVVPFAVVAGLAAYAVPISYAVGLAASLVVALSFVPRMLARRQENALPSPSRGAVAGYAAKNYALNLSEFMPGLVLPILVLEMLGPESNAAFFLGWTIATVAFLASKAVAQSSFAALVRDGDPRPSLEKGARLSLVLLAPGSFVLLVGAPHILAIFGPEYVAASTLLRLLALSVIPVAITNLFLSYLKARRAGWELTLLPAVVLVAVLAMQPYALARFGIEGAGAVWLGVQLAASAYAGVRLWAALRRTQDDQPRSLLHRRAHQG